MREQKRNRTGTAVLLSALITAVLSIVLYKTFPFVYAINDDVMMRDIASGAMTGTPDGHLIFIKYVLGFLLSRVYLLFPGFDWYGILMTGLVMFSLAVVLYRGLADIRKRSARVFYLFLTITVFVCVILQQMVLFQWTVTAAITGVAGIFLFYTGSGESLGKKRIEEALAVLLLLLAFSIRDSVFVMLLPIAGLCYLFKYGNIDKGRKFSLSVRHLAVPAALFLGCAGILLVESLAYKSPEWKKYNAYNAYRSEVYDQYGVPSYSKEKEFYASVGMQEEDVRAVKNYSLLFVDDLFDCKMQEIAEYAKTTQSETEPVGKRLLNGIERVYADFESDRYAPLTWFVFCLLLLTTVFCYQRKSRQLYLLAAGVGIQLLLWCYLGFQGRVVERVSFSMHLSTFMLTAAILFRELAVWEPEERLRWFKVCGSLLLLGIACLEWKEIKGAALEKAAVNQEYLAMCQYLNEQSDFIYLLHTNSVEQYTDNFHLRKTIPEDHMVLMGGWETFSPLEIQKREALGLLDVKKAWYERNDILIVSRFELAYLRTYFEKEFGSCHPETLQTLTCNEYTYTIEKFNK